MKRLWRKYFSPQKWCPVTNYTKLHEGPEVRPVGEMHFCGYDYCWCEWIICDYCKERIHYSDGVDECR